MAEKDRKEGSGTAFRVGAIALAFLVLGYQVALFVHKAAEERIVANRDRPDTVYIVSGGCGREESPPEGHAAPGSAGRKTFRASSGHSGRAREIYEKAPARKVESFKFNPNTVSLEELQRLGFSEKQAQSIINYRGKGGRFRRKSDFAKSYAVADSVYERLEPYIVIPKVDINKADSAAFDGLPGIGGWFAHKMVEYREQLHGYSCKEQLMDIYHFDREKFDGLKDLISCSPAPPFRFWSAPADSLRLHPHVRTWQTAKAIVLYRENTPRGQWTVEGLHAAGILTDEQASRLAKCNLE